MKRIISILVIMALTLATFLTVFSVSAVEGTPISSAEEFLAMSADGSYYLNADIELSASYENNFTGTLDGNGKTITVTASAISAFKKIVGGTVSNLTVVANFETTEAKTFGLLAREASGSFTGITVDGNVKVLADAVSFKSGAGLLFGEIVDNANLVNCVSKGSIDIQTVNHPNDDDSALLYGIGGIVGRVTLGTVYFVDCENYAYVNSLQPGMPAGGIVGETAGSTTVNIFFEGCANYGEVIAYGVPSGQGNAHTGVGGILGEALGVYSPNSTFTFVNCINSGYVHSNEACGRVTGVGGIVGRGYSPALLSIEGCINTADLDSPGPGWSGAGGIIGSVMTYGFAWSGTHGGEVHIKNCANLADLTSAQYAGGIVAVPFQFGTQDSTFCIENCANYGDVTGGSITAGIFPYAGEYGFSGITLKNCYNEGTVTSTASSASGIAYKINKLSDKSYAGDPLPTLIENCVNKGLVSAEGTEGVATGILGVVDTNDTTVKNCINLGVLTGIKGSSHIMPESTYTVTAEGNLYYGEAETEEKYGAEGDVVAIYAKADEVLQVVPANSSELIAELELVKDYTADDYISGWDAFAAARDAAMAVAKKASLQADVDKASADLATAVAGLEALVSVDLSALQAAITDAAAHEGQEAKYTPATYAAFTAALTAANNALTSNQQSVVNNAAAALTAAIAALAQKPNTEALAAAIAEGEALAAADYVSASWSSFAAVLASAKDTANNENSNQAGVDAALAALSAAMESLVKKVSVDELAAKCAEIKAGYDSDNYTVKSFAALNSALKDADNAVTANDSGADDVAALVAKIDAAVAGLVLIGDLTSLDAAIDAAEDLEEDDYTPESWTVLADALDAISKAKKPENKCNVSVADVEALAAALDAAVAGLVAYADFTELDALLASAKALVAADYTADSWAAVEAAIAAAEAVKAKGDEALAPEAEKALADLQAAIDALQAPEAEKPTEAPTDKPEETEKPTDKATEAPTDAPAAKKGCGSVIGVSAVVITAILGLGAVALKKKD